MSPPDGYRASTKDSALQNTRLKELYDAITLGASSFLTAEYKLCALFVIIVFPCIYLSIGPLSAHLVRHRRDHVEPSSPTRAAPSARALPRWAGPSRSTPPSARAA